jgi:hypothetical protein
VWQSALPPTLCAICVSVLYIQYTTVHQVIVSISAPAHGPSSCSRELTGEWMLTTGFSFLDTIAALDAGCPTDDWEVLRPFFVLHDVRRFDIACVSVVHTPCLAIPHRYNQIIDLQRSHRRSLCQRRFCIHSHGMLEGVPSRAVKLLRDMGWQAPTIFPCNLIQNPTTPSFFFFHLLALLLYRTLKRRTIGYNRNNLSHSLFPTLPITAHI